MTRLFCDRCGEDITFETKEWIALSQTVGNGSRELPFITKDLCEKCYIEVEKAYQTFLEKNKLL